MPIKLNGKTYFWTAEACKMAGISKNTFLRWVNSGVFADVAHRDRRRWRLFNEAELNRLKAEAHKLLPNGSKGRERT